MNNNNKRKRSSSLASWLNKRLRTSETNTPQVNEVVSSEVTSEVKNNLSNPPVESIPSS